MIAPVAIKCHGTTIFIHKTVFLGSAMLRQPTARIPQSRQRRRRTAVTQIKKQRILVNKKIAATANNYWCDKVHFKMKYIIVEPWQCRRVEKCSFSYIAILCTVFSPTHVHTIWILCVLYVAIYMRYTFLPNTIFSLFLQQVLDMRCVHLVYAYALR